jgi:uncharacterized protein
MLNKIVITGGNGFLGTSLAKYFQDHCKEIIIVSRKQVPTSSVIQWQKWDGEHSGPWENALENADAVINLAGKNVDCRYTTENKKQIYESRLTSTRIVGEAINNCKTPPALWINASSATIYNASFDTLMTEQRGTIGDDFSMDVCKQWEAQFNAFQFPRTRKIIMRISIVLGWDGAALPALRNLVRFGMGGKQGNGKQFCSWIHVADFCRAVEWMITNTDATGVYNVTAPQPIPNTDFMKTLRRALRIPFGLNAPKWLLEIGSFFLRTETELVLKSRKVYPKRLLDENFVFQFPDLKMALDDLVKDKNK